MAVDNLEHPTACQKMNSSRMPRPRAGRTFDFLCLVQFASAALLPTPDGPSKTRGRLDDAALAAPSQYAFNCSDTFDAAFSM